MRRLSMMMLVTLIAAVGCSAQESGEPELGATTSSSLDNTADSESPGVIRDTILDMTAAVAANVGMSDDLVSCVEGDLDSSGSLMMSAASAVDSDLPDGPEAEAFFTAWAEVMLGCGLLTQSVNETSVQLSDAFGVSLVVTQCVTDHIYGSEHAEALLVSVFVAEAMERPSPPAAPEVIGEMASDYVNSAAECGLVAELAGTMQADLGVSRSTSECIVTSLFSSDAMRPIIERSLAESIAAETSDVDELLDLSDALMAESEGEIDAVTMDAMAACATEEELQAIGLAGLGELPLEIDGYPLWSSELMSGLTVASEGYGDRRWAFGAYGDEELRYRYVVSNTEAPPIPFSDPTDLRSWIPAEGVFVIEGGFSMDLEQATTPSLDAAQLVCAPGFVGDDLEIRLARAFFEDDGWDMAVEFGLVRAMCYLDSTSSVGFIVSDNELTIDELASVLETLIASDPQG